MKTVLAGPALPVVIRAPTVEVTAGPATPVAIRWLEIPLEIMVGACPQLRVGEDDTSRVDVCVVDGRVTFDAIGTDARFVFQDFVEFAAGSSGGSGGSGLTWLGRTVMITSPYSAAALSLKGQLHMHTDAAGGADTPTEMMGAYEAAGYDFASITDHNLITADPAVAGIVFVSGTEETTGTEHVLRTHATNLSAATGPQVTIERALLDAGIAHIPHPNVGPMWTETIIDEISGYCSIEIWNARNASNAEDRWDEALGHGVRAFGMSGDDCHDRTDTSQFDRGWVRVGAAASTEAAILEALKLGNFTSHSIPLGGTELLLTIAVSGLVITATTDAAATISFIGCGLDEVPGTTLQSTAGVLTASYTVEGFEGYVRVKAVTAAGAIAWSNPIWVELVDRTDFTFGGNMRGDLHVTDHDIFGARMALGTRDIIDSVLRVEGSGPEASLYVRDAAVNNAAANWIGAKLYFEVEGAGDTPRGLEVDILFSPTASLGGAYGIRSISEFNPPLGITITSAAAIEAEFDTTNAAAGTISNAFTFRARSPSMPSLKPTCHGLYVEDQGVAGMSSCYGIRIADQTGATTIYALRSGRGMVKFGETLEVEYTRVLTSGPSDGYAGTIYLDPGYSGAFTVARHNYIQLEDVSLASGAAVTDAAVFRFDAAAGTHKALAAASTKSTPGAVDAWLKMNVNGTLYYVPAYTSMTA